MTYAQLRRTLRASLSDAAQRLGLPIDFVYEADEILRLVAHMDRTAVLLRSAEEADSAVVSRCITAVSGRSEGIPLGYLLGLSPFCGEDYYVSPGCLIPRADTEVLVEEASARLPENGILWDLCTGSGCLPIAVLLQRKDPVRAWGIELYPAALNAAQKNKKRFSDRIGERLTITRGDVLRGDVPYSDTHGVGSNPGDSGDPFARPHIITANPPYISTDTVDTLDTEVQMEPRTALDGGKDGLDYYRAILSKYLDKLAPGGCIIFEIGYDQKRAIRTLAAAFDCSCIIRRDYAGNDRVAVLCPHKDMHLPKEEDNPLSPPDGIK